MYGYYGYSPYGSAMGSLAMAAVGGIILAIIAVVATIVLTVILYKRFIGKGADPADKWTRFFRFDHFYIDGFIKGLYLLGVVGGAIFVVFSALTAGIAGGFGAFFLTLIGGVILYFIAQFFCRIGTEWTLIFVRIANDIRDIRNKFLGTPSTDEDGADIMDSLRAAGSGIEAAVRGAAAGASAAVRENRQPNAPEPPAPVAEASVAPVAPEPSAPVAPEPQHVVEETPLTGEPTPAEEPTTVVAVEETSVVVPEEAPEVDDGTWTCPTCGRTGNTGNFCASCGTPRP